jgi:UDP-N-acetylglucosamine diphosphorylase/glucosamine-1-phosphate N-acetyltransferase
MRAVYLFDDGTDLAPLTDLRASFQVRVGPLTLLERLLDEGVRPEGFSFGGIVVPATLAAVVKEGTGIEPGIRPGAGEALVLNGRCGVADWGVLRGLKAGTALVEGDRSLIAACVPEGDVARVAAGDQGSLRAVVASAATGGERWVMRRPWDAKKFRDRAIKEGMAALTAAGQGAANSGPAAEGVHRLGDHPVRVAPTARIYPLVVLDAQAGPIVIGDSAVVRPGAVISGPAYIGAHSTLHDGAVIRGNTVIGPHCKVAGEIIGSVLQAYSNKAHDGFLGDSWIGEWVNLGAGTTNSNLLNTYGEIVARATPEGSNERTGEQFLGAIIGDHVKTAISTRIMTGTVIHTGAMIATTAAASGCVGRFSWCTDEGVREYRMGKFVEMVRGMMARRSVTPGKAYLERLTVLSGSRRA